MPLPTLFPLPSFPFFSLPTSNLPHSQDVSIPLSVCNHFHPFPSETQKQFRTERTLMTEGTISHLRKEDFLIVLQHLKIIHFLSDCILVTLSFPIFPRPPYLRLLTVKFSTREFHSTCPKLPTEQMNGN